MGRFGMVKKGDVLNLTEHEAECIEGDPRFAEYNAKKHGEASGRQNDDKTVRVEELRQMTREELLAVAAAIAETNPEFTYRFDWPKERLEAAVMFFESKGTAKPAK